MWRYFDVVQAVLERHGGTVEKFIGDAVMAVFGVPAVREDDALRAVRAASELGERLAALNAELESEHGVVILTRTGINTGEVIVGGGRRRPEACNGRRRQRRGPAGAGCGAGRSPAGCGHARGRTRRSSSSRRSQPLAAKGKSRAARGPPAARAPAGRSRVCAADLDAFRRAPRRARGAARRVRRRGPRALLRARHGRRNAGHREVAPRARAARLARDGSADRGRPMHRLRRGHHVPSARGRRPRGCRRGSRSRARAILAGVERGDVAARLIAGAVGAHEERRVARGDGLGVPAASSSRSQRIAAARRRRRRHPLGGAGAARLARVRGRLLERRADPARLPRAARPLRRSARLGGAAAGVRPSSLSIRSETPSRTSSSTGCSREHDLSEQAPRTDRGERRGQPALRRADAGHALRRSRCRRGRRSADDPGAARRAHRPSRGRGARRSPACLGRGAALPSWRRQCAAPGRRRPGWHLLALARKEFVRPDRSLFPATTASASTMC